MTVPKYKRSASAVEFFHYAYTLNDRITTLLIKDFGIKRTSRDLKAFTYTAKMDGKDRAEFLELCTKYGVNVEASYPLWIVEYYRDWILALLREMINNITQANTVYATNEYEFNFRRQYQWRAIGNCYQLLQAMQTAIRILPVDVEKYMPYVNMITKELELLKAWKKGDNKILAAIKARQAEQNGAGSSAQPPGSEPTNKK